MSFNCNLDTAVKNANTGLDAIKRAPIVEHNTGIRCLRIQDVSQNKEFDNWGFTDVTTENYRKFQLKKDDILIARTGGSIGVNRYIFQDMQAVYNNGLIRIRVDTKNFYPKFVFYLLQTTSFQQHINSIAFSTAAQPNMKICDFLRFEFIRLELKQQIRIADALSIIDSKIELNRKTNQTLEQIAQTLFKSWFVDFEPTRAKIAAKEAGASPEEIERAAMCTISGKTSDQLAQLPPEIQQNLKNTAALFPDVLMDSELGEVPEGWEVRRISEIAEVIKGKSYKSSELQESKTALVTLKSFNRGGGYRLDGLKEYTGSYKSQQEVFAGDIVIAYTDVTQAADVIGKPAMIVSDFRYDHLVISLDVAVIRPHLDFFKYYIYGIAKSEVFQQHTAAHTSGTTVLHLSAKAVPDFLFASPPNPLIELFAATVSEVFKLINEKIEEVRLMENLRDTLLPKLLSGELLATDPNGEIK